MTSWTAWCTLALPAGILLLLAAKLWSPPYSQDRAWAVTLLLGVGLTACGLLAWLLYASAWAISR